MTFPLKFRALVVSGPTGSNEVTADVQRRELSRELNNGEVLVRVAYSSLNFKDALAVSGNRAVARTLPLVPGIDAVGKVEVSKDARFSVGRDVLIAHPKFGTAVDGGLAEYTIVPGEWVFGVPAGMELRHAAAIGTAGFTAAQSVMQLQKHSIEPATGPVVVSGATGGVGMFAVRMLSELGYQVTAITGKPDRVDWLRELGASHIISRDEIADDSSRPMLSGRWAGAIDTVGGHMLVDIIRTTQPRGCVTACGNVAGADLPLTVFPFILRGVTLCGIDSTGLERSEREEIWNWLSKHVCELPEVGTTNLIELEQVSSSVRSMLEGKVTGRFVVRIV